MPDFPPLLDRCLALRHRRQNDVCGNWLLDALPAADYARLKPHLRQVKLARGRVLQEEDEPLRGAYFPSRGMISLVLTAQCGTEVEVCAVGPEGMVDVGALLGCEKTAARAIVQIAGSAWWLPPEILLHEFKAGGAIQFVLRCYLQFLLSQSFQTTLCNRLHKIEARLCRWLLTTSERTQLRKLPLTQEFISHMLGTRRAGVTEACLALKRDGLIEHSRGVITILDCDALEARACECYGVLRDELHRVYGVPHAVG
jgi:CRP-like cAMP-binding protein